MRACWRIGIFVVCWTSVASASCTTAKWQPRAGQTIDLVLKALDITIQDLEALNPAIDYSGIGTFPEYNVPYKKQLLYGSWDANCPHLLHIPFQSPALIRASTLSGSEKGGSHTHTCELQTGTGSYVMTGTGVVAQPTSMACKAQELSITTISGSICQRSDSTDIPSDPPGRSTISERYDVEAIGTLMTYLRAASAGIAFSGEGEETTAAFDDDRISSRAVHSQESTGESISTTKGRLDSMMGELYTHLKQRETSWPTTTTTTTTTTTVEQTARTTTKGTKVSTTIPTTEDDRRTLTTKLQDDRSLVLITSTVTELEKETITRASPGQMTLPSPICGDESDFPGHVEIDYQRVRDTSFEWCQSPTVLGLMEVGEKCVVDVQHDSLDVLYEYSICWADDCIGEPQNRQKPLGEKGPGCELILQDTWKACNNGGVGGQVQAGCLIYKLRAGVRKGQR
ncbi:hypothetical protein FSARC_15024 [Fusarium sarcochroum]|uniref:LysM domain-containing protein n=1 Tax=Fusarium sarcochroum TaxID=1208366 RepID=A0A8H4SPI1_9HYPO|nr:hypothetical protein FSARC_15024 [Fusarium sarcochroum]